MNTTAVARGRHIPWFFVAGFAIVFAVNATMITIAVGSFSGLYTPKPRDRGLHYNEIIAAQQARDALGWRVEPMWRPDSGTLEIAVFDRAGQAVMSKIMAHEGAAEALRAGLQSGVAMKSPNAPDLNKAAEALKPAG